MTNQNPSLFATPAVIDPHAIENASGRPACAVVEHQPVSEDQPPEHVPDQIRNDRPHELECRIQRRLQAHPGLRFTRLTVHQCPQGVCLEGLLEVNDDGLDLCELVNEIAGVPALNHVVMRPALPK